MSLNDKYQPLIQMAQQSAVSNLSVQEQDGVLRMTGTAPSEEVKQRLFDEYNRIDPDMRSGDLVIDLEVGQAAAAGAGAGQTYTVQKGDTLSEIGSRHDVPWRQIFEANRDQLNDPDKIFPGQKLRIPGK
ncbi:MAG TPA: LysM peptidoglycan-binding domain-containing protein [Pyrinomonadaceae bacterium]|nr:LysM peptidoglycan-binding domain-containing protein [Pyrinomonadaceae bacterium]